MFGLGKPSEEASQKSKAVLKNVISTAGVDPSGYTVAYGYFLKTGVFSKKIYNYALALAHDESELIIVEMDSNGNSGKVIRLNSSDIQSAKRNIQGTIVLKSNGQEDLKFMIPPYTTTMADNMFQLPVTQEEEFAVLDQFLKNK